MEETDDRILHCYCSSAEVDSHMILCSDCRKFFHRGCLKSGLPSDLAGDIYFKFSCEACSPNKEEVLDRMKLQWTLVIILALYNLQLEGGGKRGFFRWREHICRFVDRHWISFFGSNKKKTATWHGTVAGTLSTGCPKYFISGVEQLGENGWWSLKNAKLPTLEEVELMISSNKNTKVRKGKAVVVPDPSVFVEGTRQRKQNVVEAAVELKAKRTTVKGSERPARKKKTPKTKKNVQVKITLSKGNDESLTFANIMPTIKTDPYEAADTTESTSADLDSSDLNFSNTIIKSEPIEDLEMSIEIDPVSDWLKQEPGDTDNIEFDIDFPAAIPPSAESFNCILSDFLNDGSEENIPIRIKEEPKDDDDCNVLEKTVTTPLKKSQISDTGRKRKAVTIEESPIIQESKDPKFTLISLYEEQKLLKQLQTYSSIISNKPNICRLRRKLIVRKMQRERNMPVFDLDNEVRTALGKNPLETDANSISLLCSEQRILDRYQTSYHNVKGISFHRTSFLTRLMGLEDEQQECVVSPYTARLLKPFIFRDYETTPLKLKLLHEIIAYPHRKDPDWKLPQRYPIDFCYVRPQHIPGINSLCHEFFWNGIDLSETLQYPDFSCVALYRKVIIGFAFMVPDVKYNEAYITYIFCHPDWRRAGLANFMLYHLIQTCMGKDITLHVSATSSALFLYQKFGFKVEEFILDFYDKYLPMHSKECRHALFLRLNR